MPNAVANNTVLNLLIGNGSHSSPVPLITSATLATSTPASPTMVTVPAGAISAILECTYTADAAAASGGGVGLFFYVGDGVSNFQIPSPLVADGYSITDGPLVPAGATRPFVIGPISVAGWASVGVTAQEDADGPHAGAFAASVVFVS